LARTERLTIRVLPNTPVSIDCVENCVGYLSLPKTAHVAISEDGSPTAFNLVLRAVDPDPGDALTWSLVTPPALGSASFDPGAAPGAQQPIQYTPAADAFGADSFVVRVRDTQGYTDQITINVEIAPVNDPPVLDAVGDRIFAKGSGEHEIVLTGIGPGPANEAGPPLTLTAEASDPTLLQNLVVDWDGANETGALRFIVGEGMGDVTVTVTLDDGQGENGTTTRAFTVTIAEIPLQYMPLILGP